MTRGPARQGRRTNDPQGMRERVLDAAAAAFQAHGYHATSTQDVMRAAGVSAGALHHHFPTKKALGLAVIRERVARSVEETWIVPVRKAADAASGVASVLVDIADGLDRQGYVQGCPLSNLALELSLTDPDFRTEMEKVFAAWRLAVAEAVRAGTRDAGASPKGEAEELASFVVAAYSGAMAMAKTSQDSGALRACARRLAALLPGGEVARGRRVRAG